MAYKKGDWNAVCDVCGFEYKASQLRKRWDNMRVCKDDWEERHPQDFLKSIRDDSSVPWTRPEGAEMFVIVDPKNPDNVSYVFVLPDSITVTESGYIVDSTGDFIIDTLGNKILWSLV